MLFACINKKPKVIHPFCTSLDLYQIALDIAFIFEIWLSFEADLRYKENSRD